MKKLLSLLLIMITCSVGIAYATGAGDTETVTSLKYVDDQLNTRQDKFGANDGKAMTFTNVAGGNLPRDVKASLGTSTSDTGLPTVSAVNAGLDDKQNTIPAANTNTVITYTGVEGTMGQKGIYQDTGTYAAQSDNLIDAGTFNAALRTGLNSEFVCSENMPGTNNCWLWTIDNTVNGTTLNYVSATGTGYQNGTPTPTNPIYPVFYQQGDMILRRVGDYADSYDATTHKITRRVGVKVLDGTENWTLQTNPTYVMDGATTFWNIGAIQDNLSVGSNRPAIGISNYLINAPVSAANLTPKIANSFSIGSTAHTAHTLWMRIEGEKTVAEWKQWLADQYAAGTPVTVYYPLATPVEEDWPDTTYNTSVYIPQNQSAQNQ